jgi:hypothetical protein
MKFVLFKCNNQLNSVPNKESKENLVDSIEEKSVIEGNL